MSLEVPMGRSGWDPDLPPAAGRVSDEELATFRRQFSALAQLAEPSLEVSSEQCLPLAIGRFQILKRLGSGNYGCVYLAHDSRLTRNVAIKVSNVGAHSSQEMRHRFIREAHAAARMAHQNVVCLHEYGEEQGLLYLVYEMCEGPTLEDWLCAQTSPIPLPAAAAIAREIAHGLAHAHERGLVHRDVKPNNVLLPSNSDERSSLPFTPRITDFGLAHDSMAIEQKSLSARLVGTVDFMSPEQLRGDMRGVTPASDQYSLGIILYRMVTGKLPFECQDFIQLLQRINRETPRSPRSLRADVPRDLEAIINTCLSKQPEARYASCNELARDLNRFLRGQAVQARPLRSYQRAWRAICAAPMVASLIAFIVLTCLASAVTFSAMAANLSSQQRVLQQTLVELTDSESSAVQARDETELALQAVTAQKLEAEQQTQRAEQQTQRAVLQSYRADMHRAYQAWEHGQVLETMQLLQNVRENVRPVMEPRSDFDLLDNLVKLSMKQLSKHTAPVTDIKAIYGTPWLVSVSENGQLQFHHSESGKLFGELRYGDKCQVHAIDVSRDGKQIAVGCVGSLLGLNYVKVHSLDLSGSAPQLGNSQSMLFSPTTVESLQFSPDGSLLALGPRYLPAMIYNVPENRLLFTVETDSRNRSVDISADGQQILILGHDNKLLIVDSSTGQVVREISCEGVSQLARFSPSGGWIAYSCSSDAVLRLISNNDEQQRVELSQPYGTIESLSFSQDGLWLAAGTRRGGIATWPLATLADAPPPSKLASMTHMVAHNGEVVAVCIDELGRVASASDSGSVVTSKLTTPSSPTFGQSVRAVGFIPDPLSGFDHLTETMLRGLADGRVQLVDSMLADAVLPDSTLRAMRVARELVPPQATAVSSVGCSADGRLSAVGWEDGNVKLIDLKTGETTSCLYDPPQDSLNQRSINSLCLCGSGQKLAGCGDDARLRVWNVEHPQQPLWEHKLRSKASATCFYGPDRVAVGGLFEEIIVFDANSGRVVQQLSGAGRVRCLKHDAYRNRLLSTHADGRLRIYAGPDLTLLHTFNVDAGEINSVTISPDHTCYLTGDSHGNLKVWSAERCEFVGDLHSLPENSSVSGLNWNAQRRELAAVFHNHSANAGEELYLQIFDSK